MCETSRQYVAITEHSDHFKLKRVLLVLKEGFDLVGAISSGTDEEPQYRPTGSADAHELKGQE